MNMILMDDIMVDAAGVGDHDDESDDDKYDSNISAEMCNIQW